MSAPRDGGPAFPRPAGPYLEDDRPAGECINTASVGMSLRDYFAGQALVGIMLGLTPSHRDGEPIVLVKEHDGNYWRDPGEIAYRVADAMLAARERPRS